jgi:hypothetical protein
MSWNRAQYQSAPTHDVENGSDLATKRKESTPRGLGITGGFGTSRNDRLNNIPLDGNGSTRRVSLPSAPSPGIFREEPGKKGVKRKAVPKSPEEQDSPFSPRSPSSARGLLSPSDQHRDSESALPHFDCQTDYALIEGRWTWLSVTVIILAVYSTVFSAIYLGIALARPRYGKKIGMDGHMSATSASILSTTLAKTIELSFVTVFVSFLGQVLSRQAIRGKAREGGVSIAEMMMRTWIMQPGMLITHQQTVRYVALTFLGTAALAAALMAMFYVTAAEALVSPKLRMGPVENRLLHGKVIAGFANSIFLADVCPTPIREKDDPVDKGTTCLQIQHASSAYNDYQLFLEGWTRSLAIKTLAASTTPQGHLP